MTALLPESSILGRENFFLLQCLESQAHKYKLRIHCSDVDKQESKLPDYLCALDS